MTTFDCVMCHNLKPYKMNNYNGWWRSIIQKKTSPKKPHSATC